MEEEEGEEVVSGWPWPPPLEGTTLDVESVVEFCFCVEWLDCVIFLATSVSEDLEVVSDGFSALLTGLDTFADFFKGVGDAAAADCFGGEIFDDDTL